MPRQPLAAVALIAIAIACSPANDAATVLAPATPSLAKSTETDPTAAYKFPFNDPTLGIQGDGQFTSGTYSVYDNDVCGVTTRIYATTEASNSGDMMFQTFAPRTKDQRCAVWPRRFRVTFPDGFSELTYSTTNLQRVENTTFQIPVGGTVKRRLNMQINTRLGGKNVYWQDADGHLWEILTVSYARPGTSSLSAAG